MQFTNPHYGQAQYVASAAEDTQNFANIREFIKDKLYFVSLSRAPPPQENVHFFTIDQQFVYTNFYADFGPSNMSHVIRFCYFMQEKFQNPDLENKALCLYTSFEVDKRANAAFLLCTYMVLVYKKTPEEAYQCLMGLNPPFIPYRDAGYGPATYHITILDCVRGLYKAIQQGLFDINSFDVEEYEFYEKVENGDYNWITKKFMALASPKDDPPPHAIERFQIKNTVSRSSQGKSLYSAYRKANLIKWMVENNIKTIIRLNNKTYEKKDFVDAGIEHIELYFPDGSTPPEMILKRFLEICETRPGPIAVHCKAGLGRTGSLIAAYLMKHYRLTACEVISFMRIVRPGSVVGPQQNYLQAMQAKLWKMTPQTRLPPQISCWSGVPPSIQINRFGYAKYTTKSANPPLPEKIRTTSEAISAKNGNYYYGSEDEATQASRKDLILTTQTVYGDVQEFEREMAKERAGQSARGIEEMSIPIQPRKHIGQHPVAKPEHQPIPGSAWKPNSTILQQNYAPQPQVVDNNGNNRYHLRHHLSGSSAQSAQQVTLNKPRQLANALDFNMEMDVDEEVVPTPKSAKKNNFLLADN